MATEREQVRSAQSHLNQEVADAIGNLGSNQSNGKVYLEIDKPDEGLYVLLKMLLKLMHGFVPEIFTHHTQYDWSKEPGCVSLEIRIKMVRPYKK